MLLYLWATLDFLPAKLEQAHACDGRRGTSDLYDPPALLTQVAGRCQSLDYARDRLRALNLVYFVGDTGFASPRLVRLRRKPVTSTMSIPHNFRFAQICGTGFTL